MAAQAGPVGPAFRHIVFLLHLQRADLQHLEALLVAGPFDLRLHADHGLGLFHIAVKLQHLFVVEAALPDQCLVHLGGGLGVVQVAADLVGLAAHIHMGDLAGGVKFIAVRHHFALGDGFAEAPGRAEDGAAIGGNA